MVRPSKPANWTKNAFDRMDETCFILTDESNHSITWKMCGSDISEKTEFTCIQNDKPYTCIQLLLWDPINYLGSISRFYSQYEIQIHSMYFMYALVELKFAISKK